MPEGTNPIHGVHAPASRPSTALLLTTLFLAGISGAPARAADPPKNIDFNRDIRPILSNSCFQCHGPDARKRKGVGKPLRLDTEEGATADLGGYAAVTRGKPDESELVSRIRSDDPTEIMPPAATGKKLSATEIEKLTEWVRQGAPYAKHWAYVKPLRPSLPEVSNRAWPRNAIDRFILARLEKEGLEPSPEADRAALIRRVSLDLTGLPPSLEDVDRFIADARPEAYDALVDRLLDRPSYGEHWARMWLDLARYADSAGYADDPPRTIWPYRDYVIRSFNANKPFDQFTIEQIAGDLLPDATDDERIATAFHRNTLTNNEGGTNDEEFRNVAVVDRVNTTMSVWMGTTIACAQCHDHKYDPLSQEEFFRLFALLNQTEDADRTDESPILPIFTADQKRRKAEWEREKSQLDETLRTPTPQLVASQDRWEQSLKADLSWQPVEPKSLSAESNAKLAVLDDQTIVAESTAKTDVYKLELPVANNRLTAIRLEALPLESLPNQGPGRADGNFVVSRITASIIPPSGRRPVGRLVRIELPGKQKYLSLAEVQVFAEAENLALRGSASQSSTDFDGPASRAIDGDTDGNYTGANSTTHTKLSDDPWWEVDLKSNQPVDRIVIWNRTDNELHTRLANFRVALLDEKRNVVWAQTVAKAPKPSAELTPSGVKAVAFATAFADYAQPSFEAASVIDNKDVSQRGWAVGGRTGQSHWLTLVPASDVEVEAGSTLSVSISQLFHLDHHTLGHFRILTSADPRAAEVARTPAAIRAILATPTEKRPAEKNAELTRYFLASVAPELKDARDRLTRITGELTRLKPESTVPIQRELASEMRRKTQIQRRGNYLDLGAEVTAGVPAVFHPLGENSPRDRLDLARWLVDSSNPLTSRVIANRYWEQLFGIGLVATSEEFGAQGDQPSHPELLDWLASDLVDHSWDLKRFVKQLVMSAAYRQGSKVTEESARTDPENRLLARGSRFRLPAETIRDQALFVAGLLSDKLYGPPVKPPQPSVGLTAAFGGGIDWETSKGEDRYRRAVYTTWRRSNPYPSMTTFDAPNREVCTVRRSRTNTPLQALVTLNDPVYIEAAQALARRIVASGSTPVDKVDWGFRLCLARRPNPEELSRLVQLHETTRSVLAKDLEKALRLATEPLGPVPPGADVADLAAWTVVANVLLNLDEMLMTR
jgi:mono/diheme cytochrome c family protein